MVVVISLTACSKPADFTYLDGKAGSFESLSGQWTVINYWAEWCKPCIKEIPELNALDSNNAHISVIGINFDGPNQELLAQQVKTLSIGFSNILMEQGVDPFMQHFTYAKPKALPTTVIIAPDLTIKVVLMGPQDEAGLAAIISNYSAAN